MADAHAFGSLRAGTSAFLLKLGVRDRVHAVLLAHNLDHRSRPARTPPTTDTNDEAPTRNVFSSGLFCRDDRI